jgi:hypothetical protein
MLDYSKGMIYKIIFEKKRYTVIYVGSTIQPLKDVLSKSRKKPMCENMKKLYMKTDPYIMLIEKFSCENRYQLKKRAQYHKDGLERETTGCR